MSDARPPAIFFYSKAGHSARAARVVAGMTDADLLPIRVDRYRVPLVWMLRGILDVGRKEIPPLARGTPDIANRRWVVVCGPVWAGQLAPPVLALLQALSGTDLPVGVLSTSGSKAEPEKAYAAAHGILGREFVATLNIPNGIDRTPEMTGRLVILAERMRAIDFQRLV